MLIGSYMVKNMNFGTTNCKPRISSSIYFYDLKIGFGWLLDLLK